uniref:Uncharacterized protein n=1 Tax=Anopheles coluzzii TaxID=1518534 RepID=A0A8W7PD18_ANOCL
MIVENAYRNTSFRSSTLSSGYFLVLTLAGSRKADAYASGPAFTVTATLPCSRSCSFFRSIGPITISSSSATFVCISSIATSMGLSSCDCRSRTGIRFNTYGKLLPWAAPDGVNGVSYMNVSTSWFCSNSRAVPIVVRFVGRVRGGTDGPLGFATAGQQFVHVLFVEIEVEIFAQLSAGSGIVQRYAGEICVSRDKILDFVKCLISVVRVIA